MTKDRPVPRAARPARDPVGGPAGRPRHRRDTRGRLGCGKPRDGRTTPLEPSSISSVRSSANPRGRAGAATTRPAPPASHSMPRSAVAPRSSRPTRGSPECGSANRLPARRRRRGAGGRDVVVEGRFTTSWVHQGYLEPRSRWPSSTTTGPPPDQRDAGHLLHALGAGQAVRSADGASGSPVRRSAAGSVASS